MDRLEGIVVRVRGAGVELAVSARRLASGSAPAPYKSGNEATEKKGSECTEDDEDNSDYGKAVVGMRAGDAAGCRGSSRLAG